MSVMTLQANFESLTSQIRRSSAAMSRQINALSSGDRITRAADDIANLSVSTTLSTRLSALRRGVLNMAQADSLLQVADGALREIDGMLQRMSGISVMANGGALSSRERAYLDIEFQQLKSEIERTLNETEFNGVKLFEDNRTATYVESVFTNPTDTLTVPTGAIIHLDPSDPTTVIDGAGRNASQAGFNPLDVARVVDISGSGNDVTQGNAAERPDYVQDVNGTVDVLRFDGSNDRMTGLVPTTSTELSVFVVFTRTGGGGSREAVWEFGSNGENSRDAIFLQGTTPRYYDRNPSGGDFRSFSDPIVYGDYTMIGTVQDGGMVEGWTNGTQTLNTPISARQPSGSFTLGDDSTSGDELHGEIAEIIAFERVLTQSEREQLEGYLAQKHNIALPAAHPFAAGVSFATGEGVSNGRFTKAGDVIGTIDVTVADPNIQYRITDGNNGAFFVDPTDNKLKILNPDKLLESEDGLFNLTIEVELSNGAITELGVEVTMDFEGLTFQSDKESDRFFEVLIEETTIEDLFANDEVNVLSVETAREAFDDVADALAVVTQRRSYVGSKQSQAQAEFDAIQARSNGQSFANGVVRDTNIAVTSTDYANEILRSNISIAIAAQTNQLHSETILSIMNDAIALN